MLLLRCRWHCLREKREILSSRYRKKTHPDKELRTLAIATHTRRCISRCSPFFSSLCTFWSQFRENEWTLYLELNLKHDWNGIRKAWLARPKIISPVIMMLRSFYKNDYSAIEINQFVKIKTFLSLITKQQRAREDIMHKKWV